MTQQMPAPVNAVNGPPAAKRYSGPEPGVYMMRATDADLGFTQGSDNGPPAPQVGVLLEFVDGKYKGTSITWYGYFTEKTKSSTIRALRTLGWQGDDLADLTTVRGEANCTVQVDVDLENNPRPVVRFIGGGAIAIKNVMTPEQKAAFALSMKELASGIKGPEKKEEEVKKTGDNVPTGAPPPKFF